MISLHEPRQIYCAQSESLLSLGIDCGSTFVSSDVKAFRVYSRAEITLVDGEYAVLSQQAQRAQYQDRRYGNEQTL
jgi:glucosamine 6-phosphate synthetase-like amidotransferase/phosphosugar isomerase protein